MSKDLRAFPRTVVNWAAACALVDPPGPPWAVRAVNVSESGFGIMSPRGLAAGTLVDLQVVVPARAGDTQARTVRLRGKVAHSVFRQDECLLGIQILTLDPADHDALRRWVLRPLLPASRLP